MKAIIEKHPFVSFLVIVYGWTWPLAALIEQSIIFPLLALFGPCIAAVVVISVSRGCAGLRELGGRFRLSRSVLVWCIVAALWPLVLLVPLWLLHLWWWGFIRFEISRLSLLSMVVAILIVGEEVGWRGFLLPYLIKRHPPLVSSLVVGLVWACWHLPNFMLPGFPHYGLPFSAFAVLTLAFSVLFTWLHLRTAGSLLVAVIFHSALNLFSLGGTEPSRQYWLKAVVYTAVAVIAGGGIYKHRHGASVSTVMA